jgi:hypothetical protein
VTKPDWQTLMGVPAFQDFIWWLIQNGGVFKYRMDEADGRNLFDEGRRSLALAVLSELETSQPAPAPDGIPAMTLIQTFRHVAQSTAIKPEKPVGRRRDQYNELHEPEGEA